jgi:hypothetical protein
MVMSSQTHSLATLSKWKEPSVSIGCGDEEKSFTSDAILLINCKN